MGSQHPDHIDFAGDYNLNGVILQNHAGTGGNLGEGGVNIQSLVQELNIYEGINQTAVYGTLVIVDSTNIIGNLIKVLSLMKLECHHIFIINYRSTLHTDTKIYVHNRIRYVNQSLYSFFESIDV